MKKFFAIIAILAVMMLPGASMAMNQTTDADLAAITGQAGITIDVTNLKIDLNIGSISYGDKDGWGSADPAGYTQSGNINFVVPLGFTSHITMGAMNLVIDVGTHDSIAAVAMVQDTVATSATFGLISTVGNAAVDKKTAIRIAATISGPITIDAIGGSIYLDGASSTEVTSLGAVNALKTHNAATVDYLVKNYGATASTLLKAAAYEKMGDTDGFGTVTPVTLMVNPALGTLSGAAVSYAKTAECLGSVGLSNIEVAIGRTQIGYLSTGAAVYSYTPTVVTISAH